MFGKRLYDEQKYMIEFSVEDINDVHRPCRNIFYDNVEHAYLSTEHVPEISSRRVEKNISIKES